jgi:HlyD family secretion protein
MSERPIWSARRQITAGLIAMAVLVFGFGGWAALAEISGAVVAMGRIEVEQNRQVVQHPDGGVVSEILVAEGQRVEAGDVLIRLDGSLLGSELAIVEGRLTEIQARRARLEAERDETDTPVFPEELIALAASKPEVAEQVEGQKRLFDARRDSAAKEKEQLTRQIDQIRSRIDGIDAQSEALTTQLALISQEKDTQQGLLDKGLAQQGTVLALQREEARLRGQVGELIGTRAQAGERITEIEVQITRIDAQLREEATQELREVGPAELELVERRRSLLEQVNRLDIRAPVAGLVLGLTVTTPRAVLDRPLVITAQVPTIHIARPPARCSAFSPAMLIGGCRLDDHVDADGLSSRSARES